MADAQFYSCPNNAIRFEAIGKTVSRPHCGVHILAFELLSPRTADIADFRLNPTFRSRVVSPYERSNVRPPRLRSALRVFKMARTEKNEA
jgi:hypothetical protein